jgi:hypothetical protein
MSVPFKKFLYPIWREGVITAWKCCNTVNTVNIIYAKRLSNNGIA